MFSKLWITFFIITNTYTCFLLICIIFFQYSVGVSYLGRVEERGDQPKINHWFDCPSRRLADCREDRRHLQGYRAYLHGYKKGTSGVKSKIKYNKIIYYCNTYCSIQVNNLAIVPVKRVLDRGYYEVKFILKGRIQKKTFRNFHTFADHPLT